MLELSLDRHQEKRLGPGPATGVVLDLHADEPLVAAWGVGHFLGKARRRHSVMAGDEADSGFLIGPGKNLFTIETEFRLRSGGGVKTAFFQGMDNGLDRQFFTFDRDPTPAQLKRVVEIVRGDRPNGGVLSAIQLVMP